MNFSEALNELKKGKFVCREGWNGKGMYLVIFYPIQENFLPYIMMRTVQDEYVPWLASQTDILSEDWMAKDIKYNSKGEIL